MADQPVQYSIGVDFGTESARAVLVNLTDGSEVATSVHPYANGVIDQRLPYTDAPLPPDTALQDADDYLQALRNTVTSVVKQAHVAAGDVVAIGIDTTACTLVFTDDELIPLSRQERFKSHPLAYARLWKHHAAQRYADLINTVARERGGINLASYGGAINAEWLLPKALQTFVEAPEIFAASAKIIEQQDFIVSTLVGKEVRGASVAGYKGTYLDEQGGYPSDDFFNALEPGFAAVREKIGETFLAPGERAGYLTETWAAELGLSERTAVAIGNIDAHVAMLGCGVITPGAMVAVMGTSVCNLMVTTERHEPSGIQGVVKDGIIPGTWGYEAGQAGVGDTFGWFAKYFAGADIADRAAISGRSIFEVAEADAADLQPGESGLLILDWLSGNRSILVDSDLSGAIVGLTLATRPHHVYRALIEAAAFGQRIIFDAFANAGITIDRFVVCGGLPNKSPLFMQTLADVLGRTVEVSSSKHTPAVGAALHGALAAGAVADWQDCTTIAPPITTSYVPVAQRRAVYDEIFALYRQLHDDLGVTNPNFMYRLRALRAAALRERETNPINPRG